MYMTSKNHMKKTKGGGELEDKLFEAIRNRNTQVVNDLIEQGVDVNIFYSNGITPLIYAIMIGNDEIIKLLINKGGADMYIENKDGITAVHYMDPSDYEQFGVDPETQKKLISRFTKTGVYELREYNGYHIPITIIPKGTILFRSTREDEVDFCGFWQWEDEEKDPTYCLYKNMNVFFYPYPGYFENNFKIYVVEKTLKIVNFIYPSHLSFNRMYKNNHKHDFLQPAQILEKGPFCKDYKGINGDWVFLEDFLRVNEDIAGYTGLVPLDIGFVHEPNYPVLNNYSLFHQDVTGTKGVPEIVLYPKQKRVLEERIFSDEEDCFNEPSNFLYLMDSHDHRLDTNPDRLEPNIMELLLSPKGYDITSRQVYLNELVQQEFNTIHVTIYNPLKMFVVWEYLPEEYQKDCVPITWSAKSKLSQFQRDINKLNEGLYEKSLIRYDKFTTNGRGGKSKKNKTRKIRKNKTRKTRKNKTRKTRKH